MEYIALLFVMGVFVLISLQQYKWSDRGLSSLFKIRRRNQMDKKYLDAPMGKVLQFRRRELIIKVGPQDGADKDNKDV